MAGRKSRRDVKWLLANRKEVVSRLAASLRDRSFRFSEMTSLTVSYPKVRTIRYPSNIEDRVVHHAMMNILEPIILSKLTSDTYGSVKGRGSTTILKALSPVLDTHPGWYFVKTDIRKFYESIDHDLMKAKLRRVIKCLPTLDLLDALIDSNEQGLAIGVYPSQYLANLYLSDIDHWVKEGARVKFYYRYMDDMVALFPDKEQARRYLAEMEVRIRALKLELKPGSRLDPVSIGINFVGFVFYPNYTWLRKRIKLRMQARIRKLTKSGVDDATFKRKIAPYFGWCKWCNARHLFRTALGKKYYIFAKNMEQKQIKKLSELQAESNWFGLPRDARVSITDLVGKEIIFYDYLNVTIKGEDKVVVKFADVNDEANPKCFLTRSGVIIDRLAKNKELMPFIATIKNDKKYLYFE